MPASLTSPDTGNLTVSKGALSIKLLPDGVSFRHMGNAPEIEITLEIEKLEHFSSLVGIRSKDKTVVLERSGELRAVLEEYTPDNLALWAMGSVDLLAAGGPSIDILSEDVISGWLKFTGANEIGAQLLVNLHNVEFAPTGSMQLIDDDDWGGIEVTGEMLLSQDTGKFGTMQVVNIPSET